MGFQQHGITQQELRLEVERLHRELQEKDTQLKLINQVGSMLTSELELEKVVKKVIDIATKISKAEFGAFFYNRTNEKGEIYSLYALSGAKQDDFSGFPMPRKTAIFGPTFHGESIVRSNDITQDERYGKNKPYHGMPAGHLPVKSYMAIPVISKSGAVLGGILFGHPKAGVFQEYEETLVKNIAAQAAVAIDNANLYGAKLEAEQRKSREQISTILESITDGFFTISNNWVVTYWNQEAERVTGRKRGELLHQDLRDVFMNPSLNGLYKKLYLAQSKYKPVSFIGYYSVFKTWLSISAYPSEEGLSVYFKDITKQRHAEELDHLGKKVLELNIKPDSDLKDTVNYYLRGLERIHPGMLCSVLLVEGGCLYTLAAPSLPNYFLQAINGVAVREGLGCCGTAAVKAKKEFSIDIGADPNWEELNSITTRANLKSCWSIPIISSTQRVMGTFAVYYQEKRLPTPEEEHSIESSNNLLQILLENKTIEKALRQSNERYDLATAAINDAIWEWDVLTDKIYSGPVFEKIFGHEAREDEHADIRISRIHPDDQRRIEQSLHKAILATNVDLWQEEYRFIKKDGSYAHVLDRAYIIRDSNLKATRLVGAMHDVTEAKTYEVERELLIEELKQNNSDLKQFSYITSHNLRAPLANLLGILKLVKLDAIIDPMNRKLIDKFNEATHKLNDTLEDLLDVLIIKNNNGLKLEHIHVQSSFEEVLKSIESLVQESGAKVSVACNEAEYAYANPSYLHSIFLNLLTNAIKYRSPERDLNIKLCTKHVGKGIEIRFSDSGLGIDLKRYKDRLFGLYQRFHRQENSKGIGLFIAQAQIKAMGGSISAESEVGVGTTFIIQLKK
ncbi:GAF domain-containing protein [Pontibacter oryzae]|uniref:histidine kinase n=1 Tax=Pontibacter oryzae TaxID=2304593 RepID=A0A399SHN0_9BACT|nr:GAF domain-containing protein [Pontibacter oryzae]RIJ42531.1 PAS domain S-box protein [Pontibacter oryzae]